MASQQGVEDCDDGNNVETDARNSCRSATCGDGVVQAGVEACDDGNEVQTEQLERLTAARCGDGLVQGRGSL